MQQDKQTRRCVHRSDSEKRKYLDAWKTSGLSANAFEHREGLDGLDDGSEAVGIDSTSNPQKLYTWGADPLRKDLFVEVDWPTCTGAPAICPLGNNQFRLTAARAEANVAAFAPDIRLHMDIGLPHPITAGVTTREEWQRWGAWGGATALTPPTPPAEYALCTGLSIERSGLFHHYWLWPSQDGGHTSGKVSRCSQGGWGVGALAHELGHQLGLGHGGNKGTGLLNNKPNYLSVMNYAYSWGLDRFSVGSAPILDPTNLSEQSTSLSAQTLTNIGKTPPFHSSRGAF